MTDDTRLNELLDRWEELRDAGSRSDARTVMR